MTLSSLDRGLLQCKVHLKFTLLLAEVKNEAIDVSTVTLAPVIKKILLTKKAIDFNSGYFSTTQSDHCLNASESGRRRASTGDVGVARKALILHNLLGIAGYSHRVTSACPWWARNGVPCAWLGRAWPDITSGCTDRIQHVDVDVTAQLGLTDTQNQLL